MQRKILLFFFFFFCSSTSAWNQTRDCTNITLTQCYLILNQTIQTEYFVKVKAEWKEERSNWTFLPRSFQPYEYSEYEHMRNTTV